MRSNYFRIKLSCLTAAILIASASIYHLHGAHRPDVRISALPSVSEPGQILDRAAKLAWLGNWEAAAPLFAAAEERFHRKRDEKNEIYAHVGYVRATIESRPYSEVAAEMATVLRSPTVQHDSRLRLWCLSVKGYADLNTDISIAKRTWNEAYEVASGLKDSQWMARSMGELGIIDYLSGNRQRAVARVGHAILSARESHDVDSEIRYLSMLGDGFIEEKRYWFAQLFLEHAIKVAENTPDAGFPFLAYQGQAAALMGSGDYNKARSLLETSLRKARDQHRPGQEGLTLMLLGNCANKMSDPRQAKRNWNDAIALLTRIHGYRPLSEALFNLATLQRNEGDLEAAANSLEEGVKYSREIGDRLYYPRDLTALAEIAVLRGQFENADHWYRASEEALEELSLRMNSSFGQAGFIEARSQTYVEHFALLRKQGRVAEAVEVIERVRGLAKYERERRFLPLDNPSQLAALETSVSSAQLALLRTTNSDNKTDLVNQLAEQERKLALAEDELGRSALTHNLKLLRLKELQKTLRDDELLLDYVLAESEASCIAITRDTTEIIPLEKGRADIEQLVANELKGIGDKRSGSSEARTLYDVLLRPAEKFHKFRLIIEPDGILHRLPFEALTDPNGNYAAKAFIISYINSGRELHLLRQKGSERSSGEPLLAIGGVSYEYLRLADGRAEVKSRSVTESLTRGVSELTGAAFPDLPHSEEEVTAIAHIAGTRAVVLHGMDATETAFKAQPLSHYRVIHFAVHAISDPHYPERAALVLGERPDDKDDGLLQAREIVHLPLNADLVTLSGCSTGLGALREEAGVESLENAFMMAGAKTVVASLWDVQDRSTTTLMGMFYKRLALGEDKARALTDAKRDFLSQFGNVSPYYWAAFVLVGEPSMPVEWPNRSQQSNNTRQPLAIGR